MTKAAETPLDKLNVRQRKFVLAYFAKPNATEAAKIAGFAEKSAHVRGCEQLKLPEIKAALRHLMDEMWAQSIMGPNELLALVSEQARNPLKHLVHATPDGDPFIDIANAPASALQHVDSVTIEDFTDAREIGPDGKPIKREVRRVKLKMVSPDSARNSLMKHHNLLGDKAAAEDLTELFTTIFSDAAARAKNRD